MHVVVVVCAGEALSVEIAVASFAPSVAGIGHDENIVEVPEFYDRVSFCIGVGEVQEEGGGVVVDVLCVVLKTVHSIVGVRCV